MEPTGKEDKFAPDMGGMLGAYCWSNVYMLFGGTDPGGADPGGRDDVFPEMGGMLGAYCWSNANMFCDGSDPGGADPAGGADKEGGILGADCLSVPKMLDVGGIGLDGMVVPVGADTKEGMDGADCFSVPKMSDGGVAVDAVVGADAPGRVDGVDGEGGAEAGEPFSSPSSAISMASIFAFA